MPISRLGISFEEKECFNVYWRIKNFSYCWANIKSPEYNYGNEKSWIELNPKYLNCEIFSLSSIYEIWVQISFLTCDGSQDESSEPLRRSQLPFSVSKDIIFGQRRDAFLPKDTLTIRCRFKTDYEPARGNAYIYSQIGVKRKCFLLTMKKFSPQCCDTKLSKLSIENSDQYGDLQLNLKSTGGINSDKQFYIEISRSFGESCYSVLKVSLLDNVGKAVNYVSDEFFFEKENIQKSWRFPPVIRNSKLLACKSMLLPNGTLSLKCDFAVTLGKVTEETAVYSYFGDIIPLLKYSDHPEMYFKNGSFSDSVTDLKTDLKSILDNGTLCDVSLEVGSDVVQAHKNILSARSPVFKAMFTKDMKETISKTVVIEDLDADTMRRLLFYMYTDAIKDYQWENIMNLYFASDKYEILGLKQRCSSFLNANISLSNVCEVLVLADLHQDQGLLSAVHDFISKYDTEVFASEVWRELEQNNSPLALQTLRDICSKNRLE